MNRLFMLVLLTLVIAGATQRAYADQIVYVATLTGSAESPPNALPGTGFATVTIDSVAHTMRVQVSFSGLTVGNTASHIHAATAVPGTGTAGVATSVPTFTGFPGVGRVLNASFSSKPQKTPGGMAQWLS